MLYLVAVSVPICPYSQCLSHMQIEVFVEDDLPGHLVLQLRIERQSGRVLWATLKAMCA